MSTHIKPSNLFICLTPLHVFTAITSTLFSTTDRILLIDQNGTLKNFYELLNQSRIVDNLTYFDSRTGATRNIISYAFESFKKSPISLLAQSITSIAKAYIFNDLAPETQYILKNTCHRDCIYIEDGSAPYNNHYIKRSWLKRKILQLAFKHYEPIHVLGTSKYVAFGYYSFPELIRNENRIKPQRKLNTRNDTAEIVTKILRSIKKNNGDEIEVLIFTPMTTENIDFMEKIISHCRLLDYKTHTVLIKNHPLAKHKPPIKNFIEAPNHIPGELIPHIYPSIKIVLGSNTSALQNIRRLFPNILALNFTKTPNGSYESFLEKIGVKNINITTHT